MGENTAIEWADHSFNPWWGCTRVSPGCDHCYAAALAHRLGDGHLWQGGRRRTLGSNWDKPLAWNRRAEREGRRARVFCASMADVFDNQVEEAWRFDLWSLIRRTPYLDWLLLTKRPQNIAKMLPRAANNCLPDWRAGWPNVWLGTSVENQTEADRRIPPLLAVPAAKRFLSCEPLLGPVDLRRVQGPNGIQTIDTLLGTSRDPDWSMPDARIDWVICGGESGPGARPISIQWVREMRDQCLAAGVPFLFKQWGEWAPAGQHRSEEPGRFAFGDYEHDRSAMHQVDHYPRQFTKFGARSVMQRVGKKLAGRQLDGVQHDAVPA